MNPIDTLKEQSKMDHGDAPIVYVPLPASELKPIPKKDEEEKDPKE